MKDMKRKESIMGAINIKKTGLALGLTMVVLRIGCLILFSIVSREQAVAFIKTLLCGVDVSSLIVTGMSMQDVVYGLIEIFVLGWLAGTLFASIYNVQACCGNKSGKKTSCCR